MLLFHVISFVILGKHGDTCKNYTPLINVGSFAKAFSRVQASHPVTAPVEVFCQLKDLNMPRRQMWYGPSTRTGLQGSKGKGFKVESIDSVLIVGVKLTYSNYFRITLGVFCIQRLMCD